jgi:hypothetical protein
MLYKYALNVFDSLIAILDVNLSKVNARIRDICEVGEEIKQSLGHSLHTHR